MNIIYLSYWGVDDGLSKATVCPNLEILDKSETISRIFYFTIERRYNSTFDKFEKVTHIPVVSGPSKFTSLLRYYLRVRQVALNQGIRLVICRSSLAGIFGDILHVIYGIPFVVESFEPHAEYMRSSGVWKSWSISYNLLSFLEKRQIRNATKLMPVSENYRKRLISLGVNRSKIEVIPCPVDTSTFKHSQKNRIELRLEMGINDETIVGVYMGKFGGIYYNEEESARVFTAADKVFKNYKTLIITPYNALTIREKVVSLGISEEKLICLSLDHSDISRYLDVADFGYSLIKTGRWKEFSSPIKDGEYWSMGLPVIITEGIGDDSKIIKDSGYGQILDENDLENSLFQFQDKLGVENLELRKAVRNLALLHRDKNKLQMRYVGALEELLI